MIKPKQNYLPGDNIAAEGTCEDGFASFCGEFERINDGEEGSQALVDESPVQNQEELAQQLWRLSPAIACEDRRARECAGSADRA
jgi:hypothetical protein